MVALVEDQILQALLREEEERCRALEAEYNMKEETRGKKVKRKKVIKPWRRPYEKSLFQGDIELLTKVEDFDYDLPSEDFRQYCRGRGVLHVAGKPGSKRWDFFANHGSTKAEYLKDPYFQFAQEINGHRYQYTQEEMEIGWKIIQLGRAQLQDCWELFTRESLALAPR